jgi:hypothetical protein
VEEKRYEEVDGSTSTLTVPVTPGVTGAPLLICQAKTHLPHNVTGHTKGRIGVTIFSILERFGIITQEVYIPMNTTKKILINLLLLVF